MSSIQNKLRVLSQRISNSQINQTEIETIDKDLNNYRKILETQSKDIFKIKIADREPLFNTVSDITELLNTFTELIKNNFLK